MKDLQDIVHELKEKGVSLKATEQPIDTGSAAGKAFLDMLGVFAEFETNLRREHQLEGIQQAKAKGHHRRHASASLTSRRKGSGRNCEGTEDGMVVRLSRAGGVRRERLKSGP